MTTNKYNIITYTRKGRVPTALSNYYYTNEGYIESTRRFTNLINSLPFDGRKMVIAFNSNKNISDTFTIASETKDRIIFNMEDSWGNFNQMLISKDNK